MWLHIKEHPPHKSLLSGQKSFIVDTGSNVSLIKPGVNNNKIEVAIIVPFGVTGDELEDKGLQRIEFYCNNQKYWHQFHVCPLPSDANGIIVMDFFSVVNAKLDLKTHDLLMSKQPSFDHGTSNWEAREANGMANRVALTVFSNSDGHGSRQRPTSEFQVGENALRNEARQQLRKVSLQDAESWIVKTTGTIKIPPRVKEIVVGRIELQKPRVSPDLLCVEPAQVPFEGLLAARGLARVVTKPIEARGVQ